MIRFRDPNEDDTEYFFGTGKYAKRISIGRGDGFVNHQFKQVIQEIGRHFRKTDSHYKKFLKESDDKIGRRVIIDKCKKLGDSIEVSQNEIKILHCSKSKWPLKVHVVYCPYRSPLIFRAVHDLVEQIAHARDICTNIQNGMNRPPKPCMRLLTPHHYRAIIDLYDNYQIGRLRERYGIQGSSLRIENTRTGILALPSPCIEEN